MIKLTSEQIKLLGQNNIIPKNCPPEQVEFFATVCEKKRLDPFQRQIHLVERKSKDNFGAWVKSYTIQSGIDGMRAIAQRNAKIKSYKRWVEKREDDLYGICEIDTEDRGIYRDELPFKEYVQKKSDGSVNTFWAKFPQTMIKKCAEESVLRMMTPEDLSGVYGDDEMMQADTEEKPKELSQHTESQIKDYRQQILDCKTTDEVSELKKQMTDEEKKAWRNLMQDHQVKLAEADIDNIIKSLRKNSDKSFPFVESIIDKQSEPRKTELINAYNLKLEKLGLDHRYEPTPF